MRKFVFLFLILIPVAFAQDDLIRKGWYRTDDSIVVDDISMLVYVGETDNILLKFDSRIKALDIGDCTTIDSIKVCLTDTRDGDNRQAYIEIYRIEPDILIKRQFSKTAFFIGEEVDVSVEIENRGSNEAKNIRYEDIFPYGINVIDANSPAYLSNNSVYWTGSLNPGETETLEYTIQAVKEIDIYQRAQVLDSISVFSGRVRLRPKSCYEFSSRLNTTNTTIGNTIGLNLTLTNKCDDDVEAVVDIILPDGLDVKGIQKTDGIYRWRTILNKDDTDMLEIEIFPFYSFVLEFPIKIAATYNEVTYETEFSESFEIQKPKLVLRTNIDDINQTEEDEHELEKDANQREELVIKIQKPNKNIFFENINVTAYTNMEFDNGRKTVSALFSRLDTEDNVNAIFTELNTPDVETKKSYYVILSATYSTQYGQTFTQEKVYEITVSPVEHLRISHDFARTEVEEFDYNNVTVRMKNTRSVDLKRIYAQEFVIFNNTREKIMSREIDLDEGQERILFEYQVQAPKAARKTSMAVETAVQYTFEGNIYQFAKQGGFSVVPKKLEIDVEPRVRGEPALGQPIDLEYSVKNKEKNEPVHNITLFFPLQPEFDLIGQRTYFISKLNPNEEIRLSDSGRLRPKILGDVKIRPFGISYQDEDGNEFNTTSSEEDFEVKAGYFIGPAIFISKNLSKADVNVSEIFTVYLDLENKGESSADVEVIDDIRKWSITLVPGEKRQLLRYLAVAESGRQTIEPAIIQYVGVNETYTTVSNSPQILVRKIVAEEEIPPVPVLVLAEEKIKLHPFASLVALTLAILIVIVGYVYVRESILAKKPPVYLEEEKMWKRY